MIEVNGLTKYFSRRAQPALKDVSFDIKDGEILGLVGLNGAGKTTGIRLAAGVILPSSGSVTIDGMDIVRDKAEASRQIGWVSEFPNFEPNAKSLSILRYLAGFYGLYGPEATARCTELLKMMGLPDAASIKFSNLSQGMKKRVALARALLGDPKNLLLDELLNGLDPEGVRFCRELMLEFRKQKKSVLLSSHILSEVQQVADRVAVIHRGCLLRILTREDLSKAAGEVLRITLGNLDPGTLEYLRTLGQVKHDGNTVWIKGPSVDPANINKVLVTKGCSLTSLVVETENLESLFFSILAEQERTVQTLGGKPL